MTTAKILRQSANEVRQGWTRWIRHDGEGNVCALGAIENAIAGRRLIGIIGMTYLTDTAAERRVDAITALASLLPPDLQANYAITRWNNADDQTAENVAAAFELAAIMVEQQACESARQPAHKKATPINALDPCEGSDHQLTTRA